MCICSIMHFITSCFYDLSKIIKTTMKKQTEKIWRDYKLNTVLVWGDRFHIRSVVCIGNITRIFIECFSYAMWHFTWYFLISSWMPWFAYSLHNSARWCWIQLMFLLCRWLEFRGCSWRVQILFNASSLYDLKQVSSSLWASVLTNKMGEMTYVLILRTVAKSYGFTHVKPF